MDGNGFIPQLDCTLHSSYSLVLFLSSSKCTVSHIASLSYHLEQKANLGFSVWMLIIQIIGSALVIIALSLHHTLDTVGWGESFTDCCNWCFRLNKLCEQFPSYTVNIIKKTIGKYEIVSKCGFSVGSIYLNSEEVHFSYFVWSRLSPQ